MESLPPDRVIQSSKSPDRVTRSSNPPDRVILFGGGIIGLCTAYYLLTLERPNHHPPKVTLVERTDTIACGASSRAAGLVMREWHDGKVLPLSRSSWKCWQEMNGLMDDGKAWNWRNIGAWGMDVDIDVGLDEGVDESVDVDEGVDEAVEEGVEIDLDTDIDINVDVDVDVDSEVKDGKGRGGRSQYRLLPEIRERVKEAEEMRGTAYKLGKQDSIAAVDPALFCQNLLSKCQSLGLDYHPSTQAASLNTTTKTITLSSKDKLKQEKDKHKQEQDNLTLTYSTLVLSAGPWTAHLARALGLPGVAISNLPGHSVIIRPSRPLSEGVVGHCIFVGVDAGVEGSKVESATGDDLSVDDDDDDTAWTDSIELVCRPDGTVYVAGENSAPRPVPPPPPPAASSSLTSPTASSTPSSSGRLPNNLPLLPEDVLPITDKRLVKKLLSSAAAASSLLDVSRGATLVKSQLCYRPVTPDGKPLLGPIGEGVKNIYVAAGHGPWGITLGPGSGRLMAELVLGLKPSIDPKAFDPSRFRY